MFEAAMGQRVVCEAVICPLINDFTLLAYKVLLSLLIRLCHLKREFCHTDILIHKSWTHSSTPVCALIDSRSFSHFGVLLMLWRFGHWGTLRRKI